MKKKLKGAKKQPAVTLGQANDTDMLNTRQASKFLGIKLRTMEEWRLARHIDLGPPFVRFSRQSVRYRKTDLLEYLKAKTVDTRRLREAEDDESSNVA